jgi:hypothetical protein
MPVLSKAEIPVCLSCLTFDEAGHLVNESHAPNRGQAGMPVVPNIVFLAKFS